jgi:xylulokinase
MARAVMEGTALAYRSLRDTLLSPAPWQHAEGLGGIQEVVQATPLLLAGGGAKSPLWAQILADVLQAPVHVVANAGDAPARGAALLAGQTLGWFDGYLPMPDFFPVEQVYTPQPAHGALYDRLYTVFTTLYPQLQGVFAGLAEIRAMR